MSQVSNLESQISSLNSQVPDLEPEDAGPGKSNPDSCDANLGLREGGLAGANGVVGTGDTPGTPSPSESAALSESGAGLTGRTLVETLDEATGTVAAAAATADCGKSGLEQGRNLRAKPNSANMRASRKHTKTRRFRRISGLSRDLTRWKRSQFGPAARVSTLKSQIGLNLARHERSLKSSLKLGVASLKRE